MSNYNSVVNLQGWFSTVDSDYIITSSASASASAENIINAESLSFSIAKKHLINAANIHANNNNYVIKQIPFPKEYDTNEVILKEKEDILKEKEDILKEKEDEVILKEKEDEVILKEKEDENDTEYFVDKELKYVNIYDDKPEII